MFVYVITSIYGVDCVETQVFYNRESAEEELKREVELFMPFNSPNIHRVKLENSSRFIISETEDPNEYIEIIMSKHEIKH